MSLFGRLTRKKKGSADVAKERLQVIIAHERGSSPERDFVPKMREEIIEVVRKYINVPEDRVRADINKEDDCDILELNITLSEDNT